MIEAAMHCVEPEIRKLFCEHGLRCTAQRLALYDVLRSSTAHPTAEELHRWVNEQKGASLSLATVYNTLDALCDARLAQRLPTANGCCRYDANLSDHLHVRFHDSAEIIDVPMELGAKLRGMLPHEVLIEIGEELDIDIDRVSIQLVARRRSPVNGASGADLVSRGPSGGCGLDPTPTRGG